MAKFCDNCGSPIIDSSMPFCPKCGAKLPITPSGMQPPPVRPPAVQQPAYPDYIPPVNNVKENAPVPTPTPMSRAEIFARAIPFFTTKNYQAQTQTDYMITFLSESRELNWILLIVLLCCGIILGVIYYFFFCPKHQVTLSLSGDVDVKVTAMGNTVQAKKDAAEFMRGI